jgi:sRNA-binding regulator protein Hfq
MLQMRIYKMTSNYEEKQDFLTHYKRNAETGWYFARICCTNNGNLWSYSTIASILIVPIILTIWTLIVAPIVALVQNQDDKFMSQKERDYLMVMINLMNGEQINELCAKLSNNNLSIFKSNNSQMFIKHMKETIDSVTHKIDMFRCDEMSKIYDENKNKAEKYIKTHKNNNENAFRIIITPSRIATTVQQKEINKKISKLFSEIIVDSKLTKHRKDYFENYLRDEANKFKNLNRVIRNEVHEIALA